MSQISELLGAKFKGTLIEDPVLDPYFITADYGGGFTVHRKRETEKGIVRFSDECYPSTFIRCLEFVAKDRLNEEGKQYSSLQDYISTWKKICTEIKDVYKEWNVNKF